MNGLAFKIITGYSIWFSLTAYNALAAVDCDAVKLSFEDCDATLATLLQDAVYVAGGNNKTFLANTDLNDDTQAEFFYDIVSEVLCSNSNVGNTTCFVDSLKQCPELANLASVKAVVLATTLAADDVSFADFTSTCDSLHVRRCQYKRQRFDGCITSIRADAGLQSGQLITLDMFCSSANVISSTTCVIETYTACPAEVFDNNVNLVPQETQNLMEDLKWNEFQDGNQLCTCHDGYNCYGTYKQNVETAKNSRSDIIEQMFAVSKEICRVEMKADLACAYNSVTDHTQCGRFYGDTFEETMRTINNHRSIYSMCDLATSSFDGNWPCVRPYLQSSFINCAAGAYLLGGSCRYLRDIYDCNVHALKGNCNQDEADYTYIEAAFYMNLAYVGDLFPCPAAPLMDCSANRTAFLQCEDQLSTGVKNYMQAMDKEPDDVLLRTDFSNLLGQDLFFDVMLDMACSATYAAASQCFVDNLLACPRLAFEPNITGIMLASGILADIDDISQSTSVCEYMSETRCELKRSRFTECIVNIRGGVQQASIDNIPISQFCLPEALGNTTCVIETHRACPDEVFVNNSLIIPPLTQTIIGVENWDAFESGQQLCDCYAGKDCHEVIQNSLSLARGLNPIRKVDHIYTQALLVSQVLCDLNDEVVCLSGALIPECRNIFRPFETNSRIALNLQSITGSCLTVKQKFNSQWECVKARLISPYTACISGSDAPELTNTDCSGLQRMYDCILEALVGHCDQEYSDRTFVNAAYDMMKIYHEDLPLCPDIKQASMAAKITVSYSTIILSAIFPILKLLAI